MTSPSSLISLVTVANCHVGGQAYAHASTGFTALAMQRGLIPACYTTIADTDSNKRYADKLELVNAIDPYGILRSEWQDNVDLWSAIMHVHVCMYLVLSPSPYTKEDLLNYKSLDCYQNFVQGWVREVLVKAVDSKRDTATRTLCRDG